MKGAITIEGVRAKVLSAGIACFAEARKGADGREHRLYFGECAGKCYVGMTSQDPKANYKGGGKDWLPAIADNPYTLTPFLWFADRKILAKAEKVVLDTTWRDRDDTYNLAIGGNGYALPTEETKAKMSASLVVRHANPTYRKKNSDAQKKSWTGERRAKASASMKKRYENPAERKRASEKGREVGARPEVKAKISAASKVANAKPEVKAKISAASKAMWQDPDYKARVSASQKIAQNTPERKVKRKAENARPEVKARKSVASKEVQSRPEVKSKNRAAHLGKKQTAETIAKRAATQKANRQLKRAQAGGLLL